MSSVDSGSNSKTMSSVYSGSTSPSARPSEDDGDSKPPSFRQSRPATSKPNLRLNTPQADEGPGEEPGAGVAALPQSTPEPSTKWVSPSDEIEGSVVGFTEDGPIHRGAVSASPPPARVSASQPSAYRAASARPSSTRPSPSARPQASSAQRPPASVRASRPVGMPTQASLAARRSSADHNRSNNNNGTNAAAGVPVVSGSADAEPNETPPATTEKEPSVSSAGEGIPKKYLYWGGALILVLIVVLAVVIPVLVTSNNNDAPPPAPVVEGTSPPVGPAPPEDGSSMSPPPTTSAPSASPGDAPVEPISALATVAQRGVLKCGINLRAGFGIADDGDYSGFDVDLCRAVAAGIFGSDAAVEYTAVESFNRFEILQSKEVDVLASVNTFTMERNVHEKSTGAPFSFSMPYIYAGLGFAGTPPFVACADQLLNITGECADLKICVRDGTTHVDRVKELLPGAGIILAPNLEAHYENLDDGICNVIAGEPADISEAVVRASGYVGDYEVGVNAFSKEPLALVTRSDDAQFSDFVNWIVQALLAAEEQGVTQSTASSFTQSDVFGEAYEDMFIQAIEAVGNYAEVYERNLAPIIPRAAINGINEGDTGLVYAFPFGSLLTEGPGPITGGTLETIIQRGHLRCGITRRAVFAEFDSQAQEWRGLDVDFCKAVSAAIFNGVTNTIVYTVLPATERFLALQEGDVDLLARITTVNIERDVFEANAGAGFAFSQPNFFDGLSFGGIPPYGACADNLDVLSAECEDLLICVNDGTTFLERLKKIFPERYIAPQQTGELTIQGLSAGLCNVIAGGAQDVSPTSVVEVGEYTGPYENGVNRFSKDPLALVTRQDDHQWSVFVYWIVSAIFYAEEADITQSTATRMPILNLFGPLYSRMLRDVIEAVGSYSEIYDRNAEDQIPRGGLNLLNANPYGPQHYPYPGL